VADVITTVGNVEEATRKIVSARSVYFMVGVLVAMLTWTANTLELVALASRAFAIYYLLQCLVAMRVSQSRAHRFSFGLIALVLAFVALFAYRHTEALRGAGGFWASPGAGPEITARDYHQPWRSTAHCL